VVFPCGYTVATDGDTINLYYGAPIRAFALRAAVFAVFLPGWTSMAIPEHSHDRRYASNRFGSAPAHPSFMNSRMTVAEMIENLSALSGIALRGIGSHFSFFSCTHTCTHTYDFRMSGHSSAIRFFEGPITVPSSNGTSGPEQFPSAAATQAESGQSQSPPTLSVNTSRLPVTNLANFLEAVSGYLHCSDTAA